MPKLNENYQNVKDSYLFAEIARRVKVYEETHPEKAADIIRLGIGDVTLPLTGRQEQAKAQLQREWQRNCLLFM